MRRTVDATRPAVAPERGAQLPLRATGRGPRRSDPMEYGGWDTDWLEFGVEENERRRVEGNRRSKTERFRPSPRRSSRYRAEQPDSHAFVSFDELDDTPGFWETVWNAGPNRQLRPIRITDEVAKVRPAPVQLPVSGTPPLHPRALRPLIPPHLTLPLCMRPRATFPGHRSPGPAPVGCLHALAGAPSQRPGDPAHLPHHPGHPPRFGSCRKPRDLRGCPPPPSWHARPAPPPQARSRPLPSSADHLNRHCSAANAALAAASRPFSSSHLTRHGHRRWLEGTERYRRRPTTAPAAPAAKPSSLSRCLEYQRGGHDGGGSSPIRGEAAGGVAASSARQGGPEGGEGQHIRAASELEARERGDRSLAQRARTDAPRDWERGRPRCVQSADRRGPNGGPWRAGLARSAAGDQRRANLGGGETSQGRLAWGPSPR